MTETKYYPVIDCDTEGKVKAELFPAFDEQKVRRVHKLWLTETVPHYFRLCRTDDGAERVKGTFHIHCPVCNLHLRLIGDGNSNDNRGLYVCDNCRND
jgi:hypothetical protein